MTRRVKIGYNRAMLVESITFVLRICLLSIVWFTTWKYIEPKTQFMRILRVTVLVLVLLVIMVMVRLTEG